MKINVKTKNWSINDGINSIVFIIWIAGLLHFSSRMWRNWERDMFRLSWDLILLTGRYGEEHYLILWYDACLRHSLIANILADGKTSRNNGQDAVSWWSFSISICENVASNGHGDLSDIVAHFCPIDDSPSQPILSHEQTLFDVIQAILLHHVQWTRYRERDVRPWSDSNVTNEEFHDHIGIDLQTGFSFGGNWWNCGTWMDQNGF